MTKRIQWLLSEIADWQREGLIDADQARALNARYQTDSDSGWGKLVFTGIGALVFGLGILLLIAYNWQGMHRFTKLALIGVSLLLAHGIGAWLRRPGGQHPRVGESLHLLGTLLFGGGIWLVAQIYHLDEYYPNAYLVWSLAALGLAWAIPSVAQGLLALWLLFLWSWFEVFDFYHPNHWAPWLVALGVMPLAWQQRSRVLLFCSLALFLALYAFAIARLDDDLIFITLFLTAGAYLGLARWAPASDFPGSAPVFQSAGGAVYLVLLFIASFGGLSDGPFYQPPQAALEWVYWAVPLVLVLLSWGLVLTQRCLGQGLAGLQSGLILLALLIAICTSLGVPLWNWILYNLIFLVHAALLMVLGVRQLRWQWVTVSGLMLAALLFARFLDLFDSLLWRATAFLVLGALLFGVGLGYSRRKQQLQEAADD